MDHLKLKFLSLISANMSSENTEKNMNEEGRKEEKR
jgi:hypothetical protein